MVAGPVNRARDFVGERLVPQRLGTLNPNAQGQLASARRPIFHPIEAPANSCHNSTQSVGSSLICQSFDSLR